MIRVLHIADVHLGARLGGFQAVAEERREAIRGAFRELPARAAAWDVDAVLVAGDLFDSARPERRDVDLAREVLRDLATGGRPVFAIPGNHDPAGRADSPWHAMPPEIIVLTAAEFGDPVSVSVAGTELHVYGVAYDPAARADPLEGFRRRAEPGVHVVLLHAGTADHPDWTGGLGLRTTTNALAELSADYVALGDHHTFRPPGSFGRAAACYPGSFAAVAVDETGPHGCAVAELEAGVPPRVRLEPTPVPHLDDLGSCDISDVSDDFEAADRAGAAAKVGSYPVVTLEGAPGFPLDAARVRRSLVERFGFAVVHDQTRFIDSSHVRALADSPTVAGHVTRLGLRRIEAAGSEDRPVAERALRLALRALDGDET